MGRKAPSERGYHPVMLSQQAFAVLEAEKQEHELTSMSAAVLHLASDRENRVTQGLDLDAMFLACRVEPKTAQRIREWLGV